MKTLTKCGLLLPLFALSFIGSLVSSSGVNAASEYDSQYNNVNNIYLQTNGCSKLDITNTWAGYMTSDPSVGESFSQALDTGSWSVSQNFNTNPTYDQVVVAYVPNGMGKVDFIKRPTSPEILFGKNGGGSVYFSVIYQQAGSCTPKVSYIGQETYVTVSTQINGSEENNNRQGWANFLVANANINYPPDYTGGQILDSHEPPQAKPQIKPDFTYQVANKSLIAHDYNSDLPTFTPDEGYTFKGYEVEWTLYKCAGGFDDTTKTCQNSSITKHEIKPQDQDFKHEITDYGDYMLEAQYLVQQCYRYPSYPATPDYCFYVDLGTEMPDYSFVSTKVYLPMNGGGFTGDTKSQSCDVSGFCQIPEKDCTTENIFINRLVCQMNNTFSVGLFNPSIVAIKKLFTSFTVPLSPPCNIPLSNVTLAPGEVFPLSQYGPKACNTTAEIRASFPLVPIITNGILALGAITMLTRMVNRLMNDKDNDVIQAI